MEKGYLALVLHAHLPYVRHPESEDYLEERWLFEAMTETYIPLLQVFEQLARENVDFRVTMSITPTLLTMLTDDLLQRRYEKHLNQLIQLAELEVLRTRKDKDFQQVALMYRERFDNIRKWYRDCGGDIIQAFRKLQDLGKLELITSAATHAFLPYVAKEEAIRAQIATATALHERHFGKRPLGIWLPECGYTSAVDKILKEYGLEYFFTDTHGLTSANPAPVFGTLSPVLTPDGLAVFARDEESSKQVWSSEIGYPGDFDYREYYRDIGYDLDFETIKPFIHPKGIRLNTGIKYYRITGRGQEKEVYDISRAREKAAEHAGNFMFNRERQVEHFAYHMGRKPIVVAPYDAELFGHWWYEGPIFLDMLLRKIHFDQNNIKTITPSEYLRLYDDFQVCQLEMSSWGRGGYGDVWLSEKNDWIYPALHTGEQRMVELAEKFLLPAPLEKRALNQAARELMLAESSDWAFIMDNNTMVDYAIKRVKQHVNRFTKLYNMLQQCEIDEAWLTDVEERDKIFPELDYRVYRASCFTSSTRRGSSTISRVLILSWEFPPMTVGGLSKHVYGLSRHLVKQGFEVHVVSTAVGDYPASEIVEGVHVHRVRVMKPDGDEFLHWAFQLNLAMYDQCDKLIKSGLEFTLIHAHDWLVCYAAKTLKKQFHIPMIATVHATEHGRNQGIHTDLQRYIHHLEWELTYEAERVIVCSAFMKNEVEQVFQLPPDKIDVLPNGIEENLLNPYTRTASDRDELRARERTITFIGRLVREKGIQTLFDAAPCILKRHPNVKFVIAGHGPMLDELSQQARTLGISNHVVFHGYVTDEERNQLLSEADVAVFPSLYEPFGIVALEAMAAHVPVVASDVGGLSDIVQHGHNGLRMFPGDAYSLAEQVLTLLSNPDYARILAETAFRDMHKYDWQQIAGETARIYQQVARNHTM